MEWILSLLNKATACKIWLYVCVKKLKVIKKILHNIFEFSISNLLYFHLNWFNKKKSSIVLQLSTYTNVRINSIFSFITYMFIFLINQSPYGIKYFVIHNKIFIEKKLKKTLCKLFSVNYRLKNCFIKDISASLYHF